MKSVKTGFTADVLTYSKGRRGKGRPKKVPRVDASLTSSVTPSSPLSSSIQDDVGHLDEIDELKDPSDATRLGSTPLLVAGFATAHLPPIRRAEVFPHALRFYLGAADRQYPQPQRGYVLKDDPLAICKKALGVHPTKSGYVYCPTALFYKRNQRAHGELPPPSPTFPRRPDARVRVLMSPESLVPLEQRVRGWIYYEDPSSSHAQDHTESSMMSPSRKRTRNHIDTDDGLDESEAYPFDSYYLNLQQNQRIRPGKRWWRPGDVILIRPGRYNSATLGFDKIDFPIEIIGETTNPQDVVIESTNPDSDVIRFNGLDLDDETIARVRMCAPDLHPAPRSCFRLCNLSLETFAPRSNAIRLRGRLTSAEIDGVLAYAAEPDIATVSLEGGVALLRSCRFTAGREGDAVMDVSNRTLLSANCDFVGSSESHDFEVDRDRVEKKNYLVLIESHVNVRFPSHRVLLRRVLESQFIQCVFRDGSGHALLHKPNFSITAEMVSEFRKIARELGWSEEEALRRLYERAELPHGSMTLVDNEFRNNQRCLENGCCVFDNSGSCLSWEEEQAFREDMRENAFIEILEAQVENFALRLPQVSAMPPNVKKCIERWRLKSPLNFDVTEEQWRRYYEERTMVELSQGGKLDEVDGYNSEESDVVFDTLAVQERIRAKVKATILGCKYFKANAEAMSQGMYLIRTRVSRDSNGTVQSVALTCRLYSPFCMATAVDFEYEWAANSRSQDGAIFSCRVVDRFAKDMTPGNEFSNGIRRRSDRTGVLFSLTECADGLTRKSASSRLLRRLGLVLFGPKLEISEVKLMSLLRYACGMGFIETLQDPHWPVQMVMLNSDLRADEETYTPRNDNVWATQATLDRDCDAMDIDDDGDDDA